MFWGCSTRKKMFRAALSCLIAALSVPFLCSDGFAQRKAPAKKPGARPAGMVYPQFKNPYGVVRWIPQQMPLKVFISHGLSISDFKNPDLPELVNEYGGPVASMDSLAQWPKLAKALIQNERIQGLRVADHYTEDMWQTAAQGISMWKPFEQYGIFKYELTNDPSEANVLVFWTPHFTNKMGMAITQSDTKGCTSKNIFPYKILQQVLAGQLDSSRVDFCPVVVQLVTCERPFGAPIPPRMLLSASAHEMGHVLGIDGHSTNPVDLMCINYGRGVISVNDAATIRYLYGLNPDLCP